MSTSRYPDNIEALLSRYGVPRDYFLVRGIPLQPEAAELASIGLDAFGREQWLTPGAAVAWGKMRAAAHAAGIDLLVISAFRSVERQCVLFERKLAAGQRWEEIVRVTMAPGYSEHHSGRALDLGTPGCPPLEEAFADTPAFEWLNTFGNLFGFHLTYPRDNQYGVVHEPWHWAFRAEGHADES
jgi:zinc D-Ala-D-Ala carboxypeptidase